jgi:putative heme-binding domain-containing protein
VRQTATCSAGLLRDAAAAPRLQELVKTDTPPLRREAATALGRIRKADAVPALFDALRSGGDRFLEHALLYALIRIGDREAILQGLRDPSPQVRRGALIALDQMDKGNLTQEEVTPQLNTDDPALQKTALSILAKRGWARGLIDLVGKWLGQKALSPHQQESVRGAVLALCKDPAVHQLVARSLQQEETPIETRLLLLESMARAPLAKLPTDWVVELGRGLQHGDERIARQAVLTIKTANVAEFDEVLVQLAKTRGTPGDLRLEALAAAAPRLAMLEPALFDFLLARVGKEMPLGDRLAAAGALGKAKLDDRQLEALARVVAEAGALELSYLLSAYERSKTPEVGKKLVMALAKSVVLPGLPPETLRRTLKDYPKQIHDAAQPLFKKLEANREEQQAILDKLSPLLKVGDVQRGREVFFSNKATCTACHAVQDQGGKIGPDLSKIGALRAPRDVLESIVFPSAAMARGYEPYLISTKKGRIYGPVLLRQQTSEAVVLVNAERQEVRIPLAEIEAIEPHGTSIMPQGLDKELSPQQLSDLAVFLMSLR